MGAYLSSPDRSKETEEGSNSQLEYAVSSMQGWRVNQEDAHNAVLDFIENDVSLFAVYDGHGGFEVSKYVAENFPAFLKAALGELPALADRPSEIDEVARKKIENCLKETFIKFDDVLRSKEVMSKLREIANKPEAEENASDESSDNAPEERAMLYEEAMMPLEELLLKYGVPAVMKMGQDIGGKSGKKARNKALKHLSPNLRAKDKKSKKIKSGDVKEIIKKSLAEKFADDAEEDEEYESNPATTNSKASKRAKTDVAESDDEHQQNEAKRSKIASPGGGGGDVKTEVEDNGTSLRRCFSEAPPSSNQEPEEKSDTEAKTAQPAANEKSSDADDKEKKSKSAIIEREKEEITICGSPKETSMSSPLHPSRQRSSKSESEAMETPKQSQAALTSWKNMQNMADKADNGCDSPETATAPSSHEEDEDDEGDVKPGSAFPAKTKESLLKKASKAGKSAENADSDDQEDTSDEEAVVLESSEEDEETDDDDEQMSSGAGEQSEDSSNVNSDSEEEDEDEEEDEVREISYEEREEQFQMPSGDTPGEDSGTTACVALVIANQLFCANIGDSRCVLCKASGEAYDMSVDHKPEDDIETKRITAAGGKITMDGRVNGGLNLSRAFGDHFYKKTSNISLADQMISAFPDVQVANIEKDDPFMVIACDGIWNSLTSQQVVDFIRMGMKDNIPLKTLCEQLCDECLAEDTVGDGTGCDNMTVVIVRFGHNKNNNSASSTTITGAASHSTGLSNGAATHNGDAAVGNGATKDNGSADDDASK